MVEHFEVKSVLSNVKTQFYAVLVANIIIFGHGCNLGWFSPALPVLLSKETPLSTGPLTNDELSWIGSVSSFGSVIGTFICGFLSILFGSKRAMIFLAFPPIIFWILVIFGNTFHHLIIGRFIAGFTGGGFQSGVTLFVSEIANNNVRGRLGALTPLARNVGVLFAFFAGSIVKYEYRPYMFIWIPLVFLFLLSMLPNTPQFHLQNGNYQKAEKALIYYKNCDIESDRQSSLLNAEFERLKSIEEVRKQNAKIQLKDFCNGPALKAIFVSVALSWFLQMTGCYTITNYASYIFEISDTVFGINISSIILAVVQIIGGLLSTQMGDTFGRKTTLSISLFGSIVGLAFLSVYLYLRQIGFDVSSYTWLPLASLSFIIFITSIGIMALVNVSAIEQFAPKIRAAGMVWYSLCNNSVSFVGDKFFPILVETIYLHGFLIFLIINCCVGLVFVAFLLKETKGQSLDSTNPIESKLSSDTDQNKC